MVRGRTWGGQLPPRVRRGKEVTARVANVSAKGLGIELPTGTDEFFYKSSFFEVVKVGEKAHQEKGKLEARHISISDKSSTMGLSVDEALSEEFFRLLAEDFQED